MSRQTLPRGCALRTSRQIQLRTFPVVGFDPATRRRAFFSTIISTGHVPFRRRAGRTAQWPYGLSPSAACRHRWRIRPTGRAIAIASPTAQHTYPTLHPSPTGVKSQNPIHDRIVPPRAAPKEIATFGPERAPSVRGRTLRRSSPPSLQPVPPNTADEFTRAASKVESKKWAGGCATPHLVSSAPRLQAASAQPI